MTTGLQEPLIFVAVPCARMRPIRSTAVAIQTAKSQCQGLVQAFATKFLWRKASET